MMTRPEFEARCRRIEDRVTRFMDRFFDAVAIVALHGIGLAAFLVLVLRIDVPTLVWWIAFVIGLVWGGGVIERLCEPPAPRFERDADDERLRARRRETRNGADSHGLSGSWRRPAPERIGKGDQC